MSLTDETFSKLHFMFGELWSVQDTMNYHDYNPDNNIICGCDCGCGGDSIEWDGAREAWEALEKQKEDIEQQIKAVLETYASRY